MRHQDKKQLFLIFFCLLFLIPALSFSQFSKFHETWRWARFTTESALPSNQIEQIEETPNGTVWVSTSQGVAWFDGYRWHRVGPLSGLPEKSVLLRVNDSTDQVLAIVGRRLFIGDISGFRPLPMVVEEETLAVHNAHFVDKDQILLIGEHQSKWRFFLFKENELSHVLSPLDSEEGGSDFRNLWKTKSTAVWYNGNDGLFRFENDRWIRVLGASSSYGSHPIRVIVEDELGNGIASIFGVDPAGIWEWTRGATPRPSRSERSHLATAMDISATGEAIVAYQSGELRARLGTTWFTMHPPFPELRGTIAVKFRKSGDLWLGTNDGLFLFRTTSQRWVRRVYNFGDKKNSINELFRATDSTLWVATEDGVEALYPHGQTKHFSGSGEKFQIITGINEDREGNIWIGSGASFPGAYRWNGEVWKHFGEKEGLHAPAIHKIRKDRKGNLWFLGLGKNFDSDNQPGAYLYCEGKFVRWGKEEGLLSGRVYDFEEDDDGGLWFATKAGISLWKNNQWRHWNSFPLLLGRIFCLEIDQEGRIWFTDGGSGLRYIDLTGNVYSVTIEHGLLDNEVWDIRCSDDGKLWVATQKGLCAFYRGVWSTFDYRSGLSTPRLNCVFVEQSKVYVGSPGGGISILSLDETNYPTRIEFDTPVLDDKNALLRWKPYAYWGSLQPGQIETRYRIDDERWSEWSRSKEVYFSEPPEGTHTLTVQAKDLFGNFDLNGQSVSFIVEPPYYRRDEFLIPIALLLLAVGYLSVRSLVRKHRYQQELQENRNRIASDLHDEVGSNLGSIGLMSQRLQRKTAIPAVHRKELGEISWIVLHTAETLREIVWYVNPQHDTLENLTYKMREIAAFMLKRIEYSFSVGNVAANHPISLDLRRNVYLIFKESLHNVLKHSKATHVDIVFSIAHECLELKIVDNGKGFAVKQKTTGDGLKNLMRRAQAIHGTLNVQSTPGDGTSIVLTAKIT